jgi:hypothetical protein
MSTNNSGQTPRSFKVISMLPASQLTDEELDILYKPISEALFVILQRHRLECLAKLDVETKPFSYRKRKYYQY